MNVRFDAEADALYIQLSDSRILESEEVHPGFIFDFDDQSRVVGIEVLSVSRNIPSFNPKLFESEVA